ncbi:right-handed parallel beta-helix repeat-containing protein [Streptomyces formicae]|uniref:Right-handed parallel beta-helix repeat-containing protein n=1 Tax=Streptomyces formicae TaxID=1616117 RepID=A0ABY3WPU9_9ACTN|nr:right-handed parallel beta-helix repeat-containing protein [Streptomyces formicae]UNM12807.1 right-handed parallel beta-helix repeat-containing protein [Streptomyces formicae]
MRWRPGTSRPPFRLTAVAAAAAVLSTGLALLPAPPATAVAGGITLHVSAQGTDRPVGIGTAARPFRTIERAQRVARAISRTHLVPVQVVVHGGTYHLDRTLTFDTRDSGTARAPVRYTAAPGEKVVLSGGRTLRPDWRTHSGAVKVADIGTGLDFDQLFVDGERQILARYPNYDPAAQILGGTAADAVSPARVATWKNPTTALVRTLHNGAWGGNSFKVTGVRADGTPELQWVGDNNRGSGMHATHRMVENVFEELDAPGEWFHDKAAGKLYYYAPDGIDLTTARIETAERAELIRVEGESPDRPVRHLSFSGFTFTQTHRTLFTHPYEKLQLGDWAIARTGAVYLRNTEYVDVRDGFFDQVGGNAVFLDGYNRRNTVAGSEFSHSGATDVAIIGRPDAVREPSTWDSFRKTIEDTTPGPKSENHPREVTVSGNHMHDNGQFEKQTSGVQISMSRRITVKGNTIHDGPRACIDINDGTWGGHLIEDNSLFDCVKETSDHGPFNSWGRDRFWPLDADDATKKAYAKLDAMETTVIRHNRIRHSSAWDIDLDDGSSNYLIENNLLLNGGVKLREGFHRTVRNNIFVNGGGHFHVWYADTGDVVENNIFVTDNPYDLIGVDMAKSGPLIDKNLFWNNGKPVADVNDAWRAQGLDAHSAIADPKFPGAGPFADPSQLDYTVADDSPALALGFRNFPMTGFGVAGSPTPPPLEWRAAPADPYKSLAEPLLGATATQIHSDELKSSVGLTDYDGLALKTVPPDSYAAQQGLRANDVIRAVDGHKVTDRTSYWSVYHRIPAGDQIRLSIWRNQAAAEVTLAKPAGTETVNNTAATAFTGSWGFSANRGAGDLADDVHYTTADGASATLTFHGTGIAVLGEKYSDQGDVEVFVDGVSQGLVDTTSAERQVQAVVFSVSGLSAGEHTVQVVKRSGKYATLDGFRITG